MAERVLGKGTLACLSALALLALAAYSEGRGRSMSLMQSELFDPAAVAQQLSQITAAQTAVFREQEKMTGFKSANQQQLVVKDLPFRLSGYTPPGGVPSAPQSSYSSSQNPGAARLHGYSQPGMTQSYGSPHASADPGPARLHGYSTGMTTGGASPWSGNAPPAYGPASLGGGWKPQVKHNARSSISRAASDFSTSKGREEIRRISLRLKGKRAQRRVSTQELSKIVGGKAVEGLKIVVTPSKPIKATPLEFSRGTKSLFAGLQASASTNLPRSATYSDPFGGMSAEGLPGAFYRYGPHPDGGVANMLTNQLSGIDNAQDRFHYSDQVYHFTPKW